VAIDGKVPRRSSDRASGKSALPMVSACECEQRLVLARIPTDAQSNEITAVPKLLQMLSLKGTIVTVDALNCQHAIAQRIVDQGGNDALALKRNQGTLHDDVGRFRDDPASKVSTAKPDVDIMAGSRRVRQPFQPILPGCARPVIDLWPEGHRQGRAHARNAGQNHDRNRLLPAEHRAVPDALERCHSIAPGVENGLHWRLDVTMNEDQDRTRLGNGPHDLAVLRHVALNAMQKEGSKGSLRGKLKRAGWNDADLTRFL
jgi:predicted transposase YbfD/YdcC